jgi:hypothetical protein
LIIALLQSFRLTHSLTHYLQYTDLCIRVMNPLSLTLSLALLLLAPAAAFYQNSDVVELDAKQFKAQVLKGDELWLVEFYGE